MTLSLQSVLPLLAWLLTAGLLTVTAFIEWRPAEKKGAPLFEEEWPPPIETLKKERPIVPLSIPGRLGYIIILIGVPLFCFAIASTMPAGLAEWQSGRLIDYANVMLGGGVNAIFFPFVLYAMGSFLVLVFKPERAAAYRIVRLGIYTGFLLALYYTAVISATGMVMFAFLMPVSAGVIMLFRTYPDFWLSKWGIAILLLLIVLFVIGSVASYGGLLGITWVALLMTAVYWVLPLASLVSWRLLNRYDRPLLATKTDKQLSALWGGGWLVTWQLSIVTAIEVYNSLPPHPPDCYIATAASQGDPTVVGSQPVSCADGQMLWVNRQLQICKAAELALIAIAPRLHAPLRWLYDWLGRPLARRINRPWLANAVYWSLKPFEWLAYRLLRLFVSPEQILRLYR